MAQNRTLIADIRAFMAETGMGPFNFGFQAVRNGRLVERLEAGGRVWPETEQEIRAFMRVERDRISARAKKAS